MLFINNLLTEFHLSGYFKRRKPPDDNDDDDADGGKNATCQPSLHKYRSRIRCRVSVKGHVNKNFLLLCTLLTVILTLMINGVAGDDRLKRAIEETINSTTPVPPSLPNAGSEYNFLFFLFSFYIRAFLMKSQLRH